MKIKSILAATLLAASAASATAQVYSVNAVGFVNVVFTNGFSIACNPLEGADNTIAALFPAPPNGTSIFKFNAATGQFEGGTFSRGSWGANATLTLVPGEGFFFRNPTSVNFTNTFVGNVKQGVLSTPLVAGFTLVGSQVPQSGLVATDLGLVPSNGDTVFKFDAATQNYVINSFIRGAWGQGEPSVSVGEGFFIKRAVSGTWSRTFQVSQ